MARRRTYRRTRRARPAARRVYSRARGSGQQKIVGNVIDGVIVGAVQNVIPNNALYGFGDVLVPLGVGWFRKNPVLQTIGGYQLGLKLAGLLTGVSGGSGFTSQG